MSDVKMVYSCDHCHYMWRDTDYDADSAEAGGSECPKCGSTMVSALDV